MTAKAKRLKLGRSARMPCDIKGETVDDEWEAVEVCFACDAVMTRFTESHDDTPFPDWFEEALRGCFDGAEKTGPDAKEWRDAYAGIIRRQRAANRVAGGAE